MGQQYSALYGEKAPLAVRDLARTRPVERLERAIRPELNRLTAD